MIYHYVILLLSCISHFCTLAEEFSEDKRTGQELLLCRKCGTDVADSHYLIYKQSPGARKTQKQQLFGHKNVTVQTLVNPFGINFDVVTTEKARCDNFGRPEGADSWFPGYAWRICACPRCGQHLGWTFESVSDKTADKPKDEIEQFHGLILSNILGENYYYKTQQKHFYVLFSGIVLALLYYKFLKYHKHLCYRFPYYDAENLQNVNEVI